MPNATSDVLNSPKSNLSLRAKWSRSTRNAAMIAGLLVALWYFLIPTLTGNFYSDLDLTLFDLGSLCESKKWLFSSHFSGILEYIGLGSPSFADAQNALLYPPRLLMLLLPLQWALPFQIAFHLGLGAASLGFLLRSYRVGPKTILTCSLGYGLMGLSVDYIGKSLYISELAWIPAYWFFFRTYLRKGSPRWALATASCVLMLMIGAAPQGVMACALISAFEGLFAVLSSKNKNTPLKKLLAILLIDLGAIGISMIQWIPTLRELKVTARATGFNLNQALAESFSPGDWLATWIPGLEDSNYIYGAGLHRVLEQVRDPLTWVRNPYFGILILSLMLVGAIRAFKRKDHRALLAVSLTALIFALGRYTPIFPLLVSLVHSLAYFRYPAKYLTLVSVGVFVFAGVSLHRVRKVSEQKPIIRMIAFAVSSAATLQLWLRSNDGKIQELAQKIDEVMGSHLVHESSVSLQNFLVDSTTRGMIAAVLVLLVCVRRKLFFPMLCVLTVADLALINFTSLPLGDESYSFSAPTLLQQFRASETKGGTPHPLPLENEVVCQTRNARFTVPQNFEFGGSPPGLNLKYKKYLSIAELNACNEVHTNPSYTLLTSGVARGLSNYPDAQMRWSRALGCTVLEAEAPLRVSETDGAEAHSFQAPYRTSSDPRQVDGMLVYRVPQPIPPWGVVKNPEWFLDPGQTIARLSTSTRPEEMQRLIFPNPSEAPDFALPSGDRASVFSLKQVAPDQIELKLEGSGGALVQVKKTFAIGWTATQGEGSDQKSLRTVAVLGQFIGVVVPDVTAGPVRLQYKTPGLELGFKVAGLGVLLILAGLGLLSTKARSPLHKP